MRHVEIDYLKPGRMDDVLEIVTTCAEIGSASLKLRQDVMRDGTLIVCAVVTVVLVGRSGKPQRLGALVETRFGRSLTKRVKRRSAGIASPSAAGAASARG